MKKWIGIAVLVVLVGALAYWKFGKTGGETPEQPGTQSSRSSSPAAAHAPSRPEPAVIAGKVLSAGDNSPVPAALVQLSPVDGESSDVRTARADGSGRWTINGVPPGSYNASATAVGFVPALLRDLDLQPGDRETIEIRLEPGGHLVSGTVSDVSGGPVAGAVVHFTPVHGMLSTRADHGFAAVSDDQGRYRLHVADGRYRAEAIHGDYVPQRKSVELHGGERVVDFSLAPGGVVEGVVLSAGTRAPVSGAEVSYVREAVVNLPGVGMMGGGGRRGMATAGEDGRFRITGLESGVIRMTARTAEGATPADTAVMLGIGEHVGGVELYIERAFSIRGRVLVAGSREPAPDVQVTAYGGNGEVAVPALQKSKKDGSFLVAGLLPGKYRLRTESDHYLGNEFGVPASVGDQDLAGVEIEVTKAATIRGRVEPAARADVSIKVGDEARPGLNVIRFGAVRTKEDGAFELGPVRPGEHTLTAIAADGRAGEASVEVASEDVDGVVIRLESKGSIAGKVVSAKGAPVTDAMVMVKEHAPSRDVTMIINGRDMTAHQSPTHEDGSFLVSGLDGGDYDVSVKDAQGQVLAWAKPDNKEFPSAPVRIQLRDGEERQGVELRVEARDGVIRGVAEDPDGNPAADVWITATPAVEPGMGFAPPPPPPSPPADEGEPAEPREVRREVMAFMTDDGGEAGGGFSGSLPPVLTDGEGRFELTGLRHGKYDLVGEGLKGTARGFLPGVETGSDVELKLQSLARIEGKVVFGGNPVKEFRVEMSGKSIRSKTVHDDEGKFTLFRVDPGRHELDVSSDVGSASVEVEVSPGKPTQVTVELERLISVRGRVVKEDGTPLVGAIVTSSPRHEDGSVEIRIMADDTTPTTDANGHFEIGLRPGRYMLIVLGTDSPGPTIMKPIAVVDRDLSLGTLTAGDLPQGPGGGAPE